jgi:hypothetical protein
MKCVVKTAPAPGCLELRDAEIPKPGDGEILVKVRAAAICGTDVHIRSFNEWSARRMKPPVTIGHEFCGEAVELGKNVRGIKPGDIVVPESHLPCGVCSDCRMGNRHVCRHTGTAGRHPGRRLCGIRFSARRHRVRRRQIRVLQDAGHSGALRAGCPRRDGLSRGGQDRGHSGLRTHRRYERDGRPQSGSHEDNRRGAQRRPGRTGPAIRSGHAYRPAGRQTPWTPCWSSQAAWVPTSP